jgi:hypothetical protein
MLRVEIRDLTRGPVVTDGELESDDPAFAGLDLQLAGPVSIRGGSKLPTERNSSGAGQSGRRSAANVADA